jgi:hypothetical protein
VAASRDVLVDVGFLCDKAAVPRTFCSIRKCCRIDCGFKIINVCKHNLDVRNFRHPLWCSWGVCSCGLLHGIRWQFVTDILGQRVTVPSSRVEQSKSFLWTARPLKIGLIHCPDMLVTNCQLNANNSYVFHSISWSVCLPLCSLTSELHSEKYLFCVLSFFRSVWY